MEIMKIIEYGDKYQRSSVYASYISLWMNNGGEVSKYRALQILNVIYIAGCQLFDKIPQRIRILDFLINLFSL